MAFTEPAPAYESVRDSAHLPTSYGATGDSSSFTLEPNHVGIVLALTLTKGSVTSFEWILQSSDDAGTTWFQETAETYATGTSTLRKVEHTAAAASLDTTETLFCFYTRKHFPFRTNRIRFKETGTQTDERLVAEIHKLTGTVVTY